MEFACSNCGRVYGSKTSLSRHVKVFHDLCYTCNKCNVDFKRINHLVRHKATEDGARQCRLNVFMRKAKRVGDKISVKSASSLSTITANTSSTAESGSPGTPPPSSSTSNPSTTAAADSETIGASILSSTEQSESPQTSFPTLNSSTTLSADLATIKALTSTQTEPPGSPTSLTTSRSTSLATTALSLSPTEPTGSQRTSSPKSNSSTEAAAAAEYEEYRYCEVCNSKVKNRRWSYHLHTKSHKHNSGIQILNDYVATIAWGHYELSNI